jgi:hypothetical protein
VTPDQDEATMRIRRHVAFRWALRITAILLALVTLHAALLAFPQLLMSHSVRAGSVTIYHDGVETAAIEDLAADVNERLSGAGLFGPSAGGRVIFFRNQTLYGIIARLARVTPEAQGFALSTVGNAFVSEARVNDLGLRTAGMPKYSIWEGSSAHTIAHELAHLGLTDLIGRGQWRELPQWKQEGIPEYVANIVPVRGDSGADLTDRVGILLDDTNWSSLRGRDRTHYRAGLLVEFLIEIRGRSLSDILVDDVTERETLADLLSWAEQPAS